jgi:hypothetical protein
MAGTLDPVSSPSLGGCPVSAGGAESRPPESWGSAAVSVVGAEGVRAASFGELQALIKPNAPIKENNGMVRPVVEKCAKDADKFE